MARAMGFMLALLLIGCKGHISREALKNLNGYWEISRVEAADGQEKTYSLNPTIDYIQLQGDRGFRKKVQPRADGTYDTSNDAIFFTVQEKQGAFFMVYQGEDSEWSEQLIQLNEKAFGVVNEQNIIYRYRRYQPIETHP